MRRWEEIRLRQHRLMAEAEHTTPAHIEQIMKSGFTMNDIKGLHRNYEDQVESEEVHRPSRPTRKGSLSRPNGAYDPPSLEINGRMQRSTSNMDMNQYDEADLEKDGKKKRSKSPWFFGKKRDQSKDKLKSKTPEPVDKRNPQGRNVIQSNLMVRTPTVRVSNVNYFELFLIENLLNYFNSFPD